MPTQCIVIDKDGNPHGPFETCAQVREFVARELPNEQECDGEGAEPTGWHTEFLWPTSIASLDKSKGAIQ